jgi:hypothetical protein
MFHGSVENSSEEITTNIEEQQAELKIPDDVNDQLVVPRPAPLGTTNWLL